MRRVSRWCAVVPVAVGLALLPPRPGPAWADAYAGPGAENGAADLWIPVVVVAVVALVARFAIRRRAAHPGAPAAAATAPGGRLHRHQPRLTPLPELEAQAAALLVATDDAVLGSAADVHLATRQVGEDAAAPYAEAVGYAGGEVAAAFRLRQRLDEDPPEDEETRRTLLGEILSRCTQAGRRLDAEAEGFDRLRALEVHAPAALAEVEAAVELLPGRVEGAATDLAALPYAPTATAPVGDHPAEARELLAFARGSLDQARTALGTDHGSAAAFVHAAESALAQATALTDAVARRAEWLRAADQRLGPPGGHHDPLVELRAMADTEADALLLARCEVDTARDVIRTHRGAVGCQARTRLAAAERRLTGGDAPAADRLARVALHLAARDLAAFSPAPPARRRGLPGLPGTSTATLTGLLLPPPPTSAGGGFGATSGGLSGPGPSTFGGPATRTRLGGGGLF